MPTLKEKVQVPPPFSRQLIPGGSLVTVPSPCPDFVTSNVTGKRSNCADTVLLGVSIVTVQEPLPEQSPLQPTN